MIKMKLSLSLLLLTVFLFSSVIRVSLYNIEESNFVFMSLDSSQDSEWDTFDYEYQLLSDSTQSYISFFTTQNLLPIWNESHCDVLGDILFPPPEV